MKVIFTFTRVAHKTPERQQAFKYIHLSFFLFGGTVGERTGFYSQRELSSRFTTQKSRGLGQTW